MQRLNARKTACALFALCAIAATALPAQTFTTLHSFNSTDGSLPYAALVQGTNGNLYGTTYSGGANNACTNGCGTVFQITPSGTLTTLYNFCSESGCADGANPSAELVEASDGSFYGTTLKGGANRYYGTVFKINPTGTLTTLYSFCSESDCADGAEPAAALVRAEDGNFYGTTSHRGAHGYGTVFKVTSDGTLTTLYSFCSESGCTDGANPYAALIQATNGNFYGTTYGGGGNDQGTVFKITPGGTLTTLHSFYFTHGTNPAAALVQASDGNFYGTTYLGGPHGFGGTIFRITPGGKFTSLHGFADTNGSVPYAGLIQATDGNLHGTTESGGAMDDGTIFKITLSGTLTTLLSFLFTDGALPVAGLVEDTSGRFYGTAQYGGANACNGDGCGTVFGLSVGLGPFVETEPIAAEAGKPIKILGNSLKGATSVTFNGTAATFTVESSSLITTTVPSGATSGTVQVVTPGGTLSSNVPFRVLQ